MPTLFVSNLSFDTSENDLRDTFRRYGEVTRCQIVRDKVTGRPRGFAFIDMVGIQQAADAIRGLSGTELDGRALRVQESQEPSRQGDRGNYFRRKRA